MTGAAAAAESNHANINAHAETVRNTRRPRAALPGLKTCPNSNTRSFPDAGTQPQAFKKRQIQMPAIFKTRKHIS